MNDSNTDSRLVLYWNNRTGEIIVEGESEPLTPEQARAQWMNCNVKDCNAAFNRLVAHDFDVQAALKSYGDEPNV